MLGTLITIGVTVTVGLIIYDILRGGVFDKLRTEIMNRIAKYEVDLADVRNEATSDLTQITNFYDKKIKDLEARLDRKADKVVDMNVKPPVIDVVTEA